MIFNLSSSDGKLFHDKIERNTIHSYATQIGARKSLPPLSKTSTAEHTALTRRSTNGTARALS